MDRDGSKAQTTGIRALVIAALLAGVLQLIPWLTVHVTNSPGPGFNEGAWGFRAGGEPQRWFDSRFDDTSGILAVRFGGPLLAACTLAFAVAFMLVWRRAPRAAAWTTVAATIALAAVSLGFLASLGNYNQNNGAAGPGQSSDAGGALVVAPLAVLVAAAASFLLMKTARSQASSSQAHAKSPGSASPSTDAMPAAAPGAWTPPPGYDPQTGLYVGQRR